MKLFITWLAVGVLLLVACMSGAQQKDAQEIEAKRAALRLSREVMFKLANDSIEDGMRLIDSLIALRPHVPEYYMHRAVAYHLMGDTVARQRVFLHMYEMYDSIMHVEPTANNAFNRALQAALAGKTTLNEAMAEAEQYAKSPQDSITLAAMQEMAGEGFTADSFFHFGIEQMKTMYNHAYDEERRQMDSLLQQKADAQRKARQTTKNMTR